MLGEPTHCARCRESLHHYWTMSWFNRDFICHPCSLRERRHPRYREAQAAEAAAMRGGDYYFSGIGKPDDL